MSPRHNVVARTAAAPFEDFATPPRKLRQTRERGTVNESIFDYRDYPGLGLASVTRELEWDFTMGGRLKVGERLLRDVESPSPGLSILDTGKTETVTTCTDSLHNRELT